MCRTAPAVNRPPGAQTVYLTFEGLRESRTIADKLMRVQIALPAMQAAGLPRARTRRRTRQPSRATGLEHALCLAAGLDSKR